MSFFLKGRGPTNIPEGQASQLFQAIAEAGVQAIQERENNFGRSRRGRRGMRMAGDMGDRRRSRLDEMRERTRGSRKRKGDINVGFGLEKEQLFNLFPDDAVTTPGFPSDDNRRREVTTPGFPSDDNRPGIRPPVRMTKEEYDRMPKKGKRKFELPPGYEGVIDKFPIDERPGIRPPRDERPGIRPPRDEVSIMPVPPFRRSNDDMRVGFGLKENPRRRRRRRSTQEKMEIRKRGSQRFKRKKKYEQSN